MTLEEAGATPQTDGFLKTPKQMLFEEAGILPPYKEGGEVSTAKMRADVLADENKLPDIKNVKVFNEIKQIVNHPGKLKRSNFSPAVVKEMTKLFGQEIFAPSKSK